MCEERAWCLDARGPHEHGKWRERSGGGGADAYQCSTSSLTQRTTTSARACPRGLALLEGANIAMLISPC